MHRISRRLIGVLVVIGALAAGGAAYTNSITGAGTDATANAAGYADVTVNGASLTDAKYGFSNDGSQINSVTFTFANDLTGKQLQFAVGASDTAVANCVSTGMTAGVIPAADVSGSVTTVTCTGLTVNTTDATDLGILVSNT